MATSNERIRDAFIVRQVNLLKRYRAVADDLLRILNRGEPLLRSIVRNASRKAQNANAARRAQILLDLRREIRTNNRVTFRQIREALQADVDSLLRQEIAFSATTLQGNLPVTIALTLPPAAELRALRRQFPVEGLTFSQWLNRLESADLSRITDAAVAGIMQRETPVQVGRRVFGSQTLRGVDGSRGATRRGVQTMVNTLMAGLTLEARRQLWANNSLVERELYVATLDSRTTIICSTLDGETFPKNEGPRPPIHFNCRSQRVPYIPGQKISRRPANRVSRDGRELAGLRGPARRRRAAELVGQVPGRTTYQEFFDRQSASFQDSVLGPTRGRLYRRGDLPLERFIDETGERLTLRQLWQREAAAFRRAGIPPPPPPD